MEKLKLLREKTGAGVADCKTALEEAGGDIDKAVEILRKKGIAKAAERSQRETRQGVIKAAVSPDAKTGYLMQINAETDFVTRNDKFQDFARRVMDLAVEKQPEDRAELLASDLRGGTVKDNLDSLSGVIGEKLEINKYDILKSDGTVAAYLHAGGKIGVLAALGKEGQSDLAYDMAMQIAAASPKYIAPGDVAADEIAKEKEIYREQLLKQGKPENMIEKIVAGKLAKFYEEVCLIKQEYIKDDSKKVGDVLGDIKVEKFIRYGL